MRVGVPKETAEGERRVALVPDAVRSLTQGEIGVVVESGAGEGSGHPDPEYADAGPGAASITAAEAAMPSSRRGIG